MLIPYVNTLEVINYLSSLRQAKVVPGPLASWKDVLDHWSRGVCNVQVDAATYFRFLEAGPPRALLGSSFLYAVGHDEPFLLFWRDTDGRFLARELTADESAEFRRIAGIKPS